MTPLFTSLGMFIIDDNQYPSAWNRADDVDVIGGGGSYAIVGARIIGGKRRASKVCGIIDKGYDFPASVQQELESWKCGLVYRADETRQTTRGVNVYDEKETRGFYYKTDKKRIEPEDIVSDDLLSHSQSYHLLCSVERCRNIIDAIQPVNPQSVYVYEPLPDACVGASFEPLKQLVLEHIDVLTPNLKEACMLAGIDEIDLETDTDEMGTVATNALEALASTFMVHMTKPGSGVVIRCGSRGCYVSSPGFKGMLPAYHSSNSDGVVDVTGGGNAFCGGFTAGLLLSNGDWLTAGVCGNLASGCVIEQLGMPQVDAVDGDVWNGTSITDRLHTYAGEHAVAAQMPWLDPNTQYPHQ